ncbi:MAG: hypothetical protein CK530_08850 [Planctomycetaceae bacterium]|nr:MAG: hypothetical protein CK530_08850 [Planctomycetaceae bacterium]
MGTADEQRISARLVGVFAGCRGGGSAGGSCRCVVGHFVQKPSHAGCGRDDCLAVSEPFHDISLESWQWRSD